MYYTCISIIHSIQQPTTLSAPIGFFLIHFSFPSLGFFSISLVFIKSPIALSFSSVFFPLLLSVTPINRDPATPSYPLGKRDPARKPPQPTHMPITLTYYISFNRYLTTANLLPHLVDPLLFFTFVFVSSHLCFFGLLQSLALFCLTLSANRILCFFSLHSMCAIRTVGDLCTIG